MAEPDTIRIGAGGTWPLLTAVIAGGIFVLAALCFAVIGLDWPPPSVGLVVVRAVLGVALILLGLWTRGFMQRSGPHVELSPEGVSGSGLPERLPWAGVQGAHLVRGGSRETTQVYVEPLLSDEALARYLAGLRPLQRTNLSSNAAAGRPIVGIPTSGLNRAPDEVAALVRTYAERYG